MSRKFRIVGWVALAALGVVWASGPAPAQQVQPALSIAAEPQRLSAGPGESAPGNLTVRNTGPVDGTVTLAASAPAGWAVTLAESQFALAAGASRTVAFAAAPDPAAATPTDGPSTFSGTVRDALGRTGQASAAVDLDYRPPAAAPPAPPPPADRTVAIVSTTAAAGLVVVLGLGYIYQARLVRLRVDRRRLGINLGTDGVFVVGVQNRSPRAATIQLRLRGVPARWSAALSFPTVRLDGGESTSVPLLVKVPVHARVSEDAQLEILARPNGWSPWLVRERVSVATVDVSDPRRGPAGPTAAAA